MRSTAAAGQTLPARHEADPAGNRPPGQPEGAQEDRGVADPDVIGKAQRAVGPRFPDEEHVPVRAANIRHAVV